MKLARTSHESKQKPSHSPVSTKGWWKSKPTKLDVFNKNKKILFITTYTCTKFELGLLFFIFLLIVFLLSLPPSRHAKYIQIFELSRVARKWHGEHYLQKSMWRK